MRVGGGEVFEVGEVAKWLDDRKIPKKDLRPRELPGATYGERFRVALKIEGRIDDLADVDVWGELLRLRGTLDVESFAEIVFTLLYLAFVDESTWSDILAAEDEDLPHLLRGATLKHRGLGELYKSVHSITEDHRHNDRLVNLVRLVHRVKGVDRGAGVFESLVDRLLAVIGRGDGTVHTPPEVVRLLATVLDPGVGATASDPCCGSGELLAGVAQHVSLHGADASACSFTGSALAPRTAALASMNLLMRGVRAEVDAKADQRVRFGEHIPSGRHDIVLTNPPFDMKSVPGTVGFSGPYGPLPPNKTNFAWLQLAVSTLNERGSAGVVMPGSTLFASGAEQRIRARMVDDGVVEAIVSLPSHLFTSTAIPVTIWVLSRRSRARADEILLVDASGLGRMTSRTQRSLSAEEWSLISGTVGNWRAGKDHEDVPGFSASVLRQRIRDQDYVLVPARYVGARSTAPATSDKSIRELRDELIHLEWQAAEVDAVAREQLDGLKLWIR
ncbi:hypothetical protein ALI22I_22915 [Saccharothrix sp. ALI-22-I]|nr:hypothetical protein ALI22I_22915 [Saccharothrix sp. ALI-22-I]